METAYINDSYYISYEKPNKCPICHWIMDPIVLREYSEQFITEYKLIITYSCTKCKDIFVAFYNIIDMKSNPILIDLFPKKPEIIDFGKYISELSPDFISFYGDASFALSNNLIDLAGMGYRKAIECLIKDFLIKHKKIDENKIINTALKNCIKHHITNEDIKVLAEKVAGLGNDYVHYYSVFKNKDINQMIDLIELTVYWMQQLIKTEMIKNEINNQVN